MGRSGKLRSIDNIRPPITKILKCQTFFFKKQMFIQYFQCDKC